ncbi:putative membrane protein [Methanonatronarchaeum thermophilum]|uniref:Putative membrane protein n=1 Tax=Methanonatronarchaeum thermophilum TaxID=1927129 RepID=A0A1Y3GDD0_9EURY|nr:heliorhodopsin HeR [Methanonatronarchaeum thermophilum]OUJ18204.1 putative membrane protein [Methanonatronarchaeum thermophilum]
MDNIERRKAISNSEISFSNLRKFNIKAGVLHLFQGVLLVVLGFWLEWSRDIYTFYLDFEVTNGVFKVLPDPTVFFTIEYLGVILASFLLISGFAHIYIAYFKNKKYNQYLSQGMNPYRWFEYSISSSIMIVLIAQFVGVWDFWSLVMIFVLNAMMIMFGYLMEKINSLTRKVDWTAYILGAISGFTAWVVIAAYFIAALSTAETQPPTFVYLILVVYFILFNTFSLNMVLQYKGIGRWSDYLYGEKTYIVLSLTAKTALAWLVFVGVFSPF